MSSLPSSSSSSGDTTTPSTSYSSSSSSTTHGGPTQPTTLPPTITTVEELRKRHEHERWFMESQIKQLSRPRLGKKPLTPEQLNEQKIKLEGELNLKHQLEEKKFFELFPNAIPSSSSSPTSSSSSVPATNSTKDTTVPKDDTAVITDMVNTTSITSPPVVSSSTSTSTSTTTASSAPSTTTLTSPKGVSSTASTNVTATASPATILTPEEAAIAARKAKAQRKRNKKASKYQIDSDDEEDTALSTGPTKKEIELQQLKEHLDPLGYEVRTIAADGNCLFRAIADQLRIQTIKDNNTVNNGSSDSSNYFDTNGISTTNNLTNTYDYNTLRLRAAEYIRSRWQEFAPFLPYEPNDNYPMDNDNNSLIHKAVVNYCDRFSRTACWGGHPEIRALSSSLGIPIVIYQANATPMEFLPSGKENLSLKNNALNDNNTTIILRLSYHKFYLSLGEHYNSVIPHNHRNNLVHGEGQQQDNDGWEQHK